MLGNLGCHLMHFPSGRFGYVGTIPTALGETAPASTSDVMGGRAFKDESGAILTWKFPTFPTAEEAIDHAKAKGVALLSTDNP